MTGRTLLDGLIIEGIVSERVIGTTGPEKLVSYLGARPYPSELILVDDGSSDGTAAIIGKSPGVRAICYQPNRGKGCAVRTGIRFFMIESAKHLHLVFDRRQRQHGFGVARRPCSRRRRKATGTSRRRVGAH